MHLTEPEKELLPTWGWRKEESEDQKAPRQHAGWFQEQRTCSLLTPAHLRCWLPPCLLSETEWNSLVHLLHCRKYLLKVLHNLHCGPATKAQAEVLAASFLAGSKIPSSQAVVSLPFSMFPVQKKPISSMWLKPNGHMHVTVFTYVGKCASSLSYA